MASYYKALTLSKPIAFVCVDVTSQIEDDSIKTFVINIADYGIQNLLDHGHDVYVTEDIHKTLNDIQTNYTHAVVYTNDTEFEGSGFFNALDNLVKDDFFVAGHILDRSNFNAYYEIHDQCFVINLNEYKTLGSPEPGNIIYNANKQLKEIIPSQDHFHDNYTPKQVTVSDTLKNYVNVPFGWNWLNSSNKIKVFDSSIRHNKRNYYSRYTEEFHKNVSYYYKKNQYTTTELFYPANTEIPVDALVKDIEQIIVPASGLNFLYYLDRCGFKDNTEIVFYDNNLHSLKMMKMIIEEFDGTDYLWFVRNNCTGVFADDKSIQQHWDSVKHLWQLSKRVKYRYEHCDMMYDLPPNVKQNGIIHLTNIFTYEPNVGFRSLLHRVSSRNLLFKDLQLNYKDVNIITTSYPEQGFLPILDQSVMARDLTIVDIAKLDVPQWHKDEIYDA